jgi:hypothetical protein
MEIDEKDYEALKANAAKAATLAAEIESLKAKPADTGNGDAERLRIELEATKAKLDELKGNDADHWKAQAKSAFEKREEAKQRAEAAEAKAKQIEDDYKAKVIADAKLRLAESTLRSAGTDEKMLEFALAKMGIDKLELDDSGKIDGISDIAVKVLEEYPQFVGGNKGASGGFGSRKYTGKTGAVHDANGNLDIAKTKESNRSGLARKMETILGK